MADISTSSSSCRRRAPARRVSPRSGRGRDIARVRGQRRGLRSRLDRAVPGRLSSAVRPRARTASRSRSRPRGATGSSPRRLSRRRDLRAHDRGLRARGALPRAGRAGVSASSACDRTAEASGSAGLLPHISNRYVGIMQMVPQWTCGHRAEPAAPLATTTSRKVRNVTALHPPAPPVVASRAPRRRCPGPRRLLRLSRRRRRRQHRGPADDVGFSIMVAAGQRRRRLLRADGRGVHRRDRRRDRDDPVPLRRVQHAGHHPAAGRQRRRHDGPRARERARRSRSSPWPRPASWSRSTRPRRASSPKARESPYEVDGEIYGQPTALAPVGLIYNGAGGEEVGIEPTPRPSTSCSRRAPRRATAARPSPCSPVAIPFNTGLFSMLVSATRVYRPTPTGTSSAPRAT